MNHNFNSTKLIKLVVIFILSASTAYSQLAEANFTLKTVNFTSYKPDAICHDCNEIGNQEYTAYINTFVKNELYSHTSGCQSCDMDGDCTYASDLLIQSGIVSEDTLRFTFYAWENNDDERCTFNASTAFFHSPDKCQSYVAGQYNYRILSAPSNNSYLTSDTYNSYGITNYPCERKWYLKHQFSLKTNWKYAGTANLLSPTCATQQTPYTKGTIRSWTTYLNSGLTYNFNTCLNTENTYLRIYGSDGYTLVASGNNNCGAGANVHFSPGASGYYYIELSHAYRNELNSDGILEYKIIGQTNETCSTAKNVTNGGTYNYNTACSSQDAPNQTCGTNSVHNDVWFKYTATTSGTLVVSNCTGNYYDSRISIYTGNCGSLTSSNAVACSDNNCGVGSMSSSVSIQVCKNVVYLISVGGANGEVGSGILNIQFTADNSNPTISCPSNLVLTNNTNVCGRLVNYTTPVGTDECPGVTTVQTSGLPSGSTFPKGITTNTFVVTDGEGRTSSCSFNIQVNDTQKPTITCPANMSVTSCGPVQVNYNLPLINDNCAAVNLTRTQGKESGAVFPIGVTTNTFFATDASGNTSTSCSFKVTVSESGPPSITCSPNITVYTNTDNGSCRSTNVLFGFYASAAGCTFSEDLIQGKAPGSDFDLGNTVNVFKVTDSSGETATCAVTVTVIDTTKPTIHCPGNITIIGSSSVCNAYVIYDAVTGTENCFKSEYPKIKRTSGLPSDTIYPLGVTLNTYSSTDYSGNSVTCSFTVSVIDILAPTITCPSNIEVNAEPDKCSAIINYTNPVVADNCGGHTIQQTLGLASGAEFPVGVTTNSFKVTDAGNLNSSCTFQVTVHDITPPVITCPENIITNGTSVIPQCSAIVFYNVIDAQDNCTTLTPDLISGLPSGSMFPQGTTSITYKVTDQAGLSSTCSFSITVNECNLPPIAVCKNITVNAGSNCLASVLPVELNDNSIDLEGGALSYSLNSAGPFDLGTHQVELTATDPGGLQSLCLATITVVDQTPPVLPVLSDFILEDCESSPPIPMAEDACAGLITATTTTTFPITQIGTTLVTWQFDDGNGNISSASQNILVNNQAAPIAPALIDIHVLGCEGTAPIPIAESVCFGSVVGTTTTVFPITMQGTTIVTWTFDDGHGNSSTANQNVIVDDVTAPETPILADAIVGECSGSPITPTTLDNCAGTITGTTTTVFPITTQGTTVVTWTFDDGHGNSSTANQHVIVDDVTAPETPILADVFVGECNGTPTPPTTLDNCAGTITGTTTTVFPITTQGTTVVTWTFDDGHGNSTTANQNIIVDDVNPPETPILADVIVGECSGTPITPTTMDNCAGTITGTTTTVFPITTQGTTVVTWTFDDGHGNSTTTNQNVIVDDVTAPESPILADVIVGECSGTPTLPTTLDNCAGIITGTTTTVFPITTQGTTVVIWTFDDGHGNSTTSNQNVIVEDVNAPETPILADVIIGECSGTPTLPTTLDVCAGTITGTTTTVFPITTQGTTVVTWTFDDGHGNTTTANQHVIVEDVTAPESPILADVIVGECSGTPITPTTLDNCAGIITGTTTTVFPITTQGTTVVTWTFDDGHGNSTTANQNVIVQDINAPGVACQSNQTRSMQTSSCLYTTIGAEFDPLSSNDNCGITSIEYILSGATIKSGINSLSGIAFNGGNTVVKWVIRDASGNSSNCNFSVTVTKSGDPALLYAYTILSNDEIKMKESIVESGGVGVIKNNKKVSLEQNSKVIATNTFVKAPKIDIKSGSQATTKIIDQVPNSILPAFKENQNPGNNDKIIADKSSAVTLNLGNYGKVEIGKNVTATFSGNANVYIKELKLKEGASLQFSQPTHLMIDKKLTGDKNVKINQAYTPDIQFYVEEKVTIEEGSKINANIYTLKELQLEKAKSNNRTYMTGLFIADKVESQDYITWNWNPDYCPLSNEQYLIGGNTSRITFETNVHNNYSSDNINADKIELYPNPALDIIYFKMPVANISNVNITLFDNMGKQLFKKMYTSNEINKSIISIDVKEFAAGLYFAHIAINDQLQLKSFIIAR